MRARTTVAAVAVTITGMFGLTACGGASGDDPASLASPSDSTTHTAAAGHASAPSAPPLLDVDTFVDRLTTASKGVGSVTIAMTTTVGGQTVHIDAKERLAAGDTAVEETMEVAGSTLVVRLVDRVGYVSGIPGVDGWVRVDPSDKDDPASRRLASALDSLDQLDPVGAVPGLRGAITSLVAAGDPVPLDGVEAQPYRVVVDTTKITGVARQELSALGASMPGTVDYTYWVGSDGLVRRISTTTMGASVEMIMTGWGDPVTIEAPPASEIVDRSARV